MASAPQIMIHRPSSELSPAQPGTPVIHAPSPKLSLCNSLFFKSHPDLQLSHHAESASECSSIHLVSDHRRHSHSQPPTPGPSTPFGQHGIPILGGGSYPHTGSPTTPAEEYACLYPPPPHLTPVHSPAGSPRSASPLTVPGTPSSGWGSDEPTMGCPIGTLDVWVLEARGLTTITGKEKPYVLLQFDRTDSVTKEYGAPPPAPKPLADIRKGAIKKGPARVGQLKSKLAGSLPIQSVTTTRRHDPAQPNGGDGTSRAQADSASTREVTDAPPVGTVEEIGTPDAPIWKHHARFDVVQPGRTILCAVYDKLAPQGGFPAHGFLGASVFEPPLVDDPGDDGMGIDVWLPLTSALDAGVKGEIRLRVLFSGLQSKTKLNVDDFQILRRVGQGSFGMVFRVRKRDTGRIYAMKVISKRHVQSEGTLAQVKAERAVLVRTLNTPFCIGLKFSFQSQTEIFFIMDYKAGGELFDHLQRAGGRFEESQARHYIGEIVLALEYLHNAGIVYRDLKPENILLDGAGHVVICDFGLSKLLGSRDGRTKTLCGTTSFVAPEVLLDEGYGICCDWWSLGVLGYEMCYGFDPFYAETRVDQYEKILSGPITLKVKKGYSDESRDFLAKLLIREPELRLGAGDAEEVKSHAFFARINWDDLAARRVSPPFKPPTPADEDTSDYHDMGRGIGTWMFSDDDCFQTHSARVSMTGPVDLDKEGVFRDFAFISPREQKLLEQFKRRSSWAAAVP